MKHKVTKVDSPKGEKRRRKRNAIERERAEEAIAFVRQHLVSIWEDLPLRHREIIEKLFNINDYKDEHKKDRPDNKTAGEEG